MVPDPFRERPRGDRHRQVDADGDFMRQKDSLITKCPSKFTTRQRPIPSTRHRHAALARRPVAALLSRSAPPSRRCRHTGDRRWVDSSRRRVYAMCGPARPPRWCCSRSPSSATTSPSRSSPTTPRRRRPMLLQADRDVVEPGGLAAALGLACSRSPPPRSLVLDPPPAARASCPGRPRCCRRSPPSSPALMLLRLRRRPRSPPPTRCRPTGVGPHPAAAAPEHDDPPADALLGLRRSSRSRSRSRSAP